MEQLALVKGFRVHCAAKLLKKNSCLFKLCNFAFRDSHVHFCVNIVSGLLLCYGLIHYFPFTALGFFPPTSFNQLFQSTIPTI